MKGLECSQHFSHHKSTGIFSICSKAANSAVSGPILPNFEPIQDFKVVLVTYKNKGDPIQNKEECSQDFSHYNHVGAKCCHGNQSSNLIWPKILCSLSPTPIMLQMKF